jgi:hypothetical protein
MTTLCKTRLGTLLLLVVASGFCFSQSAVTRPELNDVGGVVSFSGPWRFHPGDDAAWAKRLFDDSTWVQVTSDKTLAAQGFKGFQGFGWYRLRVRVPNRSEPLAVMLPDINSSYVVYADEREIGHFGEMPPHTIVFFGAPKVFELPEAGPSGEITLAVRVWTIATERSPGMDGGEAALGAPAVVEILRQHARDREQVYPSIGLWVSTLFDLLVTIGMLAVWFGQRDHKEYLVLALGNAFFVVGNVLALAAVFEILPANWEQFGANAAWYITLVLAIEFVYAFVDVKPSVVVRLFQAAQAGLAVVSIVGLVTGKISSQLVNAGQGPAALLVAVVTLIVLYPEWKVKRHPEIRVVLLTSTAYFLGLSVNFLAMAALKLGLWHLSTGASSIPKILPDLYLGDVPISSSTIMDILLDIAFFTIVLQRHHRVSRERERTKTELAAARTVQQVMLPELITIFNGFTVQAEYLPAAEVGGDFYQVIKTDSGCLLVVTGDVSGKGLPAAMLVALLIGAIRAEAAHTTDPAMLLKVLNARVHGRIKNGFATCAALYVREDGLAMLSNAANPAPYLNGEEVEVDGALPLGLIPSIDYATRAFWLESGDALTFVSDGVLEAVRNRELFGFERTRKIIRTSPKEIAEAARAFGQADDITVVTIGRD